MTSNRKILAIQGKAFWISGDTVEVTGNLGRTILSSNGQELSRMFYEHHDKHSQYLLIAKDRLSEVRQQGVDVKISLEKGKLIAAENIQEINKEIAYKLMLARISVQIAPILISYVAISPRIKEWITRSQWLKQIGNPNEVLSQQLLGSAIGYRRFLIESCVLGLAKVLESAFLIINDEAKTKFKKAYDRYFDDLLHVNDIRMIYRCNNVIKHHRSIIPGTNNSNGKYLIEVCGFKEGDDIVYLGIDLPKQFCHTYIFLLDLLRKLTNISEPLLHLSEEERCREIIERFMPGN